MDTYSLMREFADSWALLAMMLFFGGVALYTFRPGSAAKSRDAASIPLRNGDNLEEDQMAQESTKKEDRS